MGSRDSPGAGSSPASLLDPRSTGGRVAWGAFRAQTGYIGLRLAGWLRDAGFVGFQPERSEDVDVRFERDGGAVRQLHQVKTGELTLHEVGALIRGYRSRSDAAGAHSADKRKFVVACPRLAAPVRHLVVALERYRKLDFVAAHVEATDTRRDLRKRFEKKGLGDEFEFVVRHVEFCEDFAGLEGSLGADEHARYDRMAAALGREVREFTNFSFDEMRHAAHALIRLIDDRQDHFWTRDEIVEEVRRAVEGLRAGPRHDKPDLLLVRHEGYGRVYASPDRDDLPALFAGRRIRSTLRVGDVLAPPWECAALERHAQAIAARSSPFRAGMENSDAELLYFGFPHVPFAALAGYVAGQQRHVHVVEHDRTVGRFRWSGDADIAPLSIVSAAGPSGSIAMVRISISATVNETLCRQVLASEPRLDLSFSTESPCRGAVRTECHARAYVQQIQQRLDRELAGNPAFDAVHVFAAVPVSVAFLFGQALAGTAMPDVFVHNFRRDYSPAYCWNICLQRADRELPAVSLAKGALRV